MSDTVQIKVPDIGNFEGVEVIEVMVAEGDTVAVEDGLITIETDKAAMDVPSTHAGKITKLLVKAGDKVSEGTPIAEIEATEKQDVGAAPSRREKEPAPSRREEKGAPSEPPVGAAPSHREQEPAPSRRADGTPPHASPSVRKLARELGVDLTRVNGSAKKGRITHDDVKAFVKGVMQGGGMGGPSFEPAPRIDFSQWGPVEAELLTRIQKIAGPHLQRAWATIPHVTQHDEADITDMETVRQSLKADAEKLGAKLTPLAFIIKACALTLKEFPRFNSSLDGDQLIVKQYFHIGFAVDTPEGLVVPVIRDADKKNVFDIAKELGEISGKARDKKLKAKDMQGGTFSVSSLGGIGGTAFTPIVNAPEVAILGVSKSQMKPVWDGDDFKPRLMLPLSLSYDHRVIDGAAAARFTTHLAKVLHDVEGLVL
ncbi:MAG: dihydrolipoyllysine-residue acetyltransferase [Gammaproteobacteria bacterium]